MKNRVHEARTHAPLMALHGRPADTVEVADDGSIVARWDSPELGLTSGRVVGPRRQHMFFDYEAKSGSLKQAVRAGLLDFVEEELPMGNSKWPITVWSTKTDERSYGRTMMPVLNSPEYTRFYEMWVPPSETGHKRATRGALSTLVKSIRKGFNL